MANTSVFIPAGVSIVTDASLSGDGTLGSPLEVVSDQIAAPGSTTQVIFNDGGALGADADLTWNKTTNVLTKASSAVPSFADLAAPPADTALGAVATPFGAVFAGDTVSFSNVVDDEGQIYVGSPKSSFIAGMQSAFITGSRTIEAYHGLSANWVNEHTLAVQTTDSGEVASMIASFTDGTGTVFGQEVFAGASGAGNVTLAICYAGSAATISTGNVVSSQAFKVYDGFAVDVGTLTNQYGFHSDDLTFGATLNVGFHSAVSAGTGKYAFWAEGTALSVFNGDVQLGTGKALKTDTTTAHTALLQAYDVDGTAYKTFATLTNGNTPSFVIAAPSGGALTVGGMVLTTAVVPATTGTRYLIIDASGNVTSSASAPSGT